MKQAIEDRIQAMVQCHDAYFTHKLQAFFDEAPTAVKH